MSDVSCADLARVPRWTAEQTGQLAGRCRGSLLGPWGPNLVRRYGPGAVERTRAHLPASLAQLSAQPGAKQWLPALAQLLLTEAIVDEFLDGQMLQLLPLLVEDTRRASSRPALAVLRRLGPRRMFKLAPRSHGRVYDVGTVEADVGRRGATLRFSGAALFGHPTWRVLQVMAQQTLLSLMGGQAQITARDTGGDEFAVVASW